MAARADSTLGIAEARTVVSGGDTADCWLAPALGNARSNVNAMSAAANRDDMKRGSG
jgi:hypothetical protein